MCSIMGYCGSEAVLADFKEGFDKTVSRGPDDSRIIDTGRGLLGFHRLAIMGLHPEGMQPFERDGDYLVCNGEIYGFEMEREALCKKGYSFVSGSDCEILLPMYREYGVEMFKMLDAEFALILFDGKTKQYVAARDPIGIRPLYYGYTENGTVVFASEPKNLLGLTDKIQPFPPGHYYRDGKFVCYRSITERGSLCSDPPQAVFEGIRSRLVEGVEKRMVADAKVGFLLSGGLDSSLVCAIAAKRSALPIKTFAVGMQGDAIDLKYARRVADYIGSDHRELIITRQEVLDSLETVIELLATFDITTIRASIGMYLICKYIHESTDIRVLLTGEISDELFGYKYTDFAPDGEAFQAESEKRVEQLHMYDVLRADRCISVNSLEARVPFGDLEFVRYVLSIDPEKKLNRYGKGKYLLRRAFWQDWLPQDILWREKAAFSDAVGHSMVDELKRYAQEVYTDEEFAEKQKKYTHARPFTKESLLYRELFEKHYPNQGEMIADFWMPNKSWQGCNVNDPSARVLSNYGDSGK